MTMADFIEINKVFHDHECEYYDERFAIVHDQRAAKRALSEVETLLGERIPQGASVLDVGCGTGWYAAGLSKARPDLFVMGSDLSAGMLSRAREAGAGNLIQGDATKLPFADGAIDLIVARGVLHHMPDVEGSLAEWRRVLNPKGVLVVTSEPTPTVEQHGGWLVRGLLPLLRRPLSDIEDFWEVASMAANLHVFTVEQLEDISKAAGWSDINYRTADMVSTMVLTASYVTHGRRPGLARRLPWRAMEEAGRVVDTHVIDRFVPQRFRHTIVGTLRP